MASELHPSGYLGEQLQIALLREAHELICALLFHVIMNEGTTDLDLKPGNPLRERISKWNNQLKQIGIVG